MWNRRFNLQIKYQLFLQVFFSELKYFLKNDYEDIDIGLVVSKKYIVIELRLNKG